MHYRQYSRAVEGPVHAAQGAVARQAAHVTHSTRDWHRTHLYAAPCQTQNQSAGLDSRTPHEAHASHWLPMLCSACAASPALHAAGSMHWLQGLLCLQPPGSAQGSHYPQDTGWTQHCTQRRNFRARAERSALDQSCAAHNARSSLHNTGSEHSVLAPGGRHGQDPAPEALHRGLVLVQPENQFRDIYPAYKAG